MFGERFQKFQSAPFFLLENTDSTIDKDDIFLKRTWFKNDLNLGTWKITKIPFTLIYVS